MTESTLLDLPFDAVQERLIKLGQPSYRTVQIWQSVYRDPVASYEEMTTLPIKLRAELAAQLPFGRLAPEAMRESPDRRTRKTLLRLDDGEAIETVSMRYDDRQTVCISTQVGCAMDCRICATARGGFTRNLSGGEIVGQVLNAARGFRHEGRRLTNVVYMGTGEPFANCDATFSSIRILNDPRGFNLGARSFTVSTVGIVPGIERFADEGLQANLAVSLHAANDDLRARLLPINRIHPIGPLLRACREYVARTHRRITFEVALIDGINDSPAHAVELADLLRGLLCHVNLIPFNPISGLTWRRSSDERVNRFSNVLEKRSVPVTIRISRGAEIQAGCGQLRAKQTDAVG